MRWLFECFELKSEFTSKCLWWSIHPSNVGFRSWKYNSNTKHMPHLILIQYFQLLIIMKRLNGRGSVTWKNIVLEQDLFWSQISLIGHICVVLLYAVCQSERVYLYKENMIRVTQLLFWLQASRVPTSVQNCCFQCLVSDFHVFCHTPLTMRGSVRSFAPKGDTSCFLTGRIVCGAFLASLKSFGGCFEIAITPSLSGADTTQPANFTLQPNYQEDILH